jgi:GTP-binding protein
MKPVIVLVGRPNVGKSTLFNRLTRARDALVADIPGVTRDRQYGEGRRGDRPYLLVDTGGVVEDLGAAHQRSASIETHMREQTRQAVEEGDSIVFIVDGREGLTPADRELANFLRRSGKPVVVAVNKAEGMEPSTITAEFHALGLGAPAAISAQHGDGVDELIAEVLRDLPRAEEAELSADIPRIAIAGRPNVGKSTLVNAMLGEPRVVVFDQPGTTRDSIRIPLERRGKDYVLIDTAGVRRRKHVREVVEKFSIIKTLQAIDEANVVILVVDAAEGLSDQDAHLAGYVLEKGRSLVVALNKSDRLDREQRAWAERELQRRFAFLSFVRAHFISALHGTGVGALFSSVDQAFASARKTMPTSRLNHMLQRAVQSTPPPMVHGRRIKPKFAHQGGKNPPTVVVHGSQVDRLPESYRRYLANCVRKEFRLEGTPVRIECRAGANPYAAVRDSRRRRRG